MTKETTMTSLEELKSLVKDFLETEVYPHELDWLSQPFKVLEAGILKEKRAKVKTLGLWAPHLSPDHEGLGMSLPAFAHLSELLGTSPFGHYLFNCQAPDIGNMELMLEYAPDHLKEAYLVPLMNGDTRSCFGMTEPENAGSNPVRMDTTAELKGDRLIINGHKWFTTGADGADFCIVMAVTDPEAAPHQRASMILVPTDHPGFENVRNISIMGEPNEGHHSHSEIRLNNCDVPATNLIGQVGEGFKLAQKRLGPGRIHHCMRWIGICERAFAMMCERAASRELTSKTRLAHQQTIQNWVAESRAAIMSARLMVLHTANLIEQKGTSAAREEISIIKFTVAQTLQLILDRAIQVHGALGITDDTLLSFWFRHERGARIYDGPDEVHKSVVARNVFKQYGLDIKRNE